MEGQKTKLNSELFILYHACYVITSIPVKLSAHLSYVDTSPRLNLINIIPSTKALLISWCMFTTLFASQFMHRCVC